MKNILKVCIIYFYINTYSYFFQLPHAYQQILSAEKTPTLWGTLPAFEALLVKLQEHALSDLDSYEIIQEGIKKLEEYQQETTNVPAYILSLCE